MEDLLALVLFIGLILGLATGHPIAFVLGGISIIIGFVGWGPEIVPIVSRGILSTMNDYTLVAIPLFVFMANLLSSSQVVDGLFESLRYLFGRLRGGLALSIIVVSTIFAATTGVIGASVVTMGVLGMPILMKYKYNTELSVGTITAGGSLGILIPPSIMLIVMGAQANVSVGDLFKSTLIPGLLLALTYCIYIVIITWIKPQHGPALTAEEAAAMPVKKRITNSLVNLVPPLLLILAVLGSIYAGIATPTEASGVGAFVALLMTIGYKKFSFKMLSDAVYETARTTAMVLMIMVGASAFSATFLGLNGSELIVQFVNTIGIEEWGTLIFMLILTFIMGMFIDWVGIVMIIFPVFIPLLEKTDFNMLWVVTCIAIMLQTSFLTPPFGHALFYIKGVVGDQVSTVTIYKGVIPFIIIITIVLGIAMIFPQIIMWLPELL